MIEELWTKRYPFEDCCASPIELVQVLEETKDIGKRICPSKQFPSTMRSFLMSLLHVDSAKRAAAR